MEFISVSKGVSPSKKKIAEKRFQKLLLDLGIKENNRNVGSGLGGNNFLLITLLHFDHELVKGNKIQFVPKKKKMSWGIDVFLQNSWVDLRGLLDRAATQIPEDCKYGALLIESSMIEKTDILPAIHQYPLHFRNLIAAITGTTFKFSPDLTMIEKLIQSFVACQFLTRELETQTLTMNATIQNVGDLIVKMPDEACLLSVREFVGMARILDHRLDQSPHWSPLFERIHKLMGCGSLNGW